MDWIALSEQDFEYSYNDNLYYVQLGFDLIPNQKIDKIINQRNLNH